MLTSIGQLFLYIYEELSFRFYYAPIFHRFINHKYDYYSKLPWPLKVKFLRTMHDNYVYFQFIPRDRIRLTRAMKAIISCAAAQLVLFLPSEGLSYYTKIIVYPDYYNSRITHRRHKGEVNPGMRIIVFSWRGIAEGMKDKEDGINLLLHEFAHALWLEHKMMGHRYAVLDPSVIARFEAYAEAEMEDLQANEQHFFRKYAFQNIEEFFAVAVENFFERSEKFQQAQPELYRILVSLFNQDPLTLHASHTKQKPLLR